MSLRNIPPANRTPGSLDRLSSMRMAVNVGIGLGLGLGSAARPTRADEPEDTFQLREVVSDQTRKFNQAVRQAIVEQYATLKARLAELEELALTDEAFGQEAAVVREQLAELVRFVGL